MDGEGRTVDGRGVTVNGKTAAPETAAPETAASLESGILGNMGRDVGPWLVGIGLLVAAVGLLTWVGGLSWFGRLPGDIRITTDHTRIFIPITSMIVVSLVLSLILFLVRRR